MTNKEKHKIWYAKNKEEQLAKQRAHYKSDKGQAVRRAYLEANKEVLKEKRRIYNEKNKQRLRERDRQRYYADPEAELERNKEYREKNKQRLREQHVFRTYGITVDQLEALRTESKDHCAICGRVSKRLCIDHCHKTNKVRGLLCRTCNIGLGAFDDNRSVLTLAIAYLAKHDV